MRHLMPHHCEEPNCTRTKGFATSNDLDRHRRSVHKIGNLRYWKCFGNKCKQPAKIWPRVDNFKQHLKRMHDDEDPVRLMRLADEWSGAEKGQEQLVNQAEGQDSRPTMSPMVTEHNQNPISPSIASETHLSPSWRPSRSHGIGQQPQSQRRIRSRHGSFNNQDLSTRINPLLFSQNSRQLYAQSSDWYYGELTDSGSPRAPNHQVSALSFADLYPHPVARPSPARTMPNPEVSSMADVSDPASTLSAHPSDPVDFAHIATNLPLPTGEAQRADDATGLSSFKAPAPPPRADLVALGEYFKQAFGRNPDVDPNHKKLFEQVVQAGLEKLKESSIGTSGKSSSSVASSLSSSHKGSNDSAKRFQCESPHCDQSFPRPSELKKHTSRHTRPFGCTYPKCYDKFGSKYDWKRHESSQHIQQQCWRCDVTSQGNGVGHSPCGKFFCKEQLFKEHLDLAHSIQESDKVQEKIQNRRIGPGGSGSFWCGFCKDIRPLKQKAEHAANERFDHIHNHFKDGRNILDWLELAEGGRLKRDMKRQHPKKPLEEGDHPDDTSQEDPDEVLISNAIPMGRAETSVDTRSVPNQPHQFSNLSMAQFSRKRTHSNLFDISPGSQPSHNLKRQKKTVSHKSSGLQKFFYVCCNCKESHCLISINPQCPSCGHERCDQCNRDARTYDEDGINYP